MAYGREIQAHSYILEKDRGRRSRKVEEAGVRKRLWRWGKDKGKKRREEGRSGRKRKRERARGRQTERYAAWLPEAFPFSSLICRFIEDLHFFPFVYIIAPPYCFKGASKRNIPIMTTSALTPVDGEQGVRCLVGVSSVSPDGIPPGWNHPSALGSWKQQN